MDRPEEIRRFYMEKATWRNVRRELVEGGLSSLFVRMGGKERDLGGLFGSESLFIGYSGARTGVGRGGFLSTLQDS